MRDDSERVRASDRAFVRYWWASAVSAGGTAITAVALPVLVVQTLDASPMDVGIVNAAQMLPYALLGLVAGVWVDRWRRKPLLIAASIGRAVVLALIPVLWALGALHLWVLLALLFAFGALSVFGFAAAQSLLPRIVPRARLLTANARLDQADAAAQTAGPALGGGLVAAVGAPIAMAVDALSFVVEAVLIARVRVEERRGPRTPARLSAQVREGLSWTYRHPALAPLAVSTHVWFVANAAGMTVLALVALRQAGLSPFAFGLIVAAGAVATLAGAVLAPHLGARWGAGGTIIAARAVYPVAWGIVAVVAMTDAVSSPPLASSLLGAGLVLHGFAGGVENANEMGYRQAVTPDALLGRMNATLRSVNRTMAAAGALAGGAVVAMAGTAPALIGVVALCAVACVLAVLSPALRAARHEPALDETPG